MIGDGGAEPRHPARAQRQVRRVRTQRRSHEYITVASHRPRITTGARQRVHGTGLHRSTRLEHIPASGTDPGQAGAAHRGGTGAHGAVTPGNPGAFERAIRGAKLHGIERRKQHGRLSCGFRAGNCDLGAVRHAPFLCERIDRRARERARPGFGDHGRRRPDVHGEPAHVVAAEFVGLEFDGAGEPAALLRSEPHEDFRAGRDDPSGGSARTERDAKRHRVGRGRGGAHGAARRPVRRLRHGAHDGPVLRGRERGRKDRRGHAVEVDGVRPARGLRVGQHGDLSRGNAGAFRELRRMRHRAVQVAGAAQRVGPVERGTQRAHAAADDLPVRCHEPEPVAGRGAIQRRARRVLQSREDGRAIHHHGSAQRVVEHDR